jgi:hypothetical protein
MRHAARLWLCLTLLGTIAACQDKTPGKIKKSASPAGSGQQLDRMQFSSAKRVALQSASEAIFNGDLERLKQLRVWVRQRADVALFEPDDLASLDAAIACLEQSSTAAATLEQLEEVESGTLRKPAQNLCSSKLP